jgi:hypothetical protein
MMTLVHQFGIGTSPLFYFLLYIYYTIIELSCQGKIFGRIAVYSGATAERAPLPFKDFPYIGGAGKFWGFWKLFTNLGGNASGNRLANLTSTGII